MAVVEEDIKELFAPLSLSNEEIAPHLERAALDFSSIEFQTQLEEKEAIGSKTLYYLAPLIWSKTSAKAREFEETLETYGDMEKFQEYWLERANTIIAKYKQNSGGLQWAAI